MEDRATGGRPVQGELDESPFAGFETEDETDRRSRKPLVITLVVVLLLLGAYGAAAAYLGDRVAAGTTVAGVSIGGLTEDEAEQRLVEGLAEVSQEPVPVRLGEQEATIDPAAVGLAVDAQATVEDLTGFSLNPADLFAHVFGGDAAEPVTTADAEALTAALEGVAETLDVAPVEGAIAFSGATPEITEPVDGTAVDVPAAVDLVVADWLTGERPLELPSTPVEPTIGEEDVEEALTTLAEPLVSAPVAASVDGRVVELTPEDLAARAQLLPEGDALVLQLDGEALVSLIAERAPDLGVEGEDARFELQGGRPVIVPSTTGRGLEAAAVATAVAEAGTSTTDRTAELTLTEVEPEFTTADAEALGINEVVVEFSTPIPYDPVRTENLRVGSRYVTGTLVRPGEEFSLLETLGPITEARGFVSSGVVEEGVFTTALGGGLSQLSTNMYNLGFLAGFDDVTHQPHSRYFDRYPAVREATLWEGSIDMVWRNNTDHGVLVESWVGDDGRLHGRLWGTKVWDVETWTSDRYNITQPTTVYDTSADCEPDAGGQVGFTATTHRERYRDGALVDEESWTWTYQPWNRVVCGPPPSAEPRPEPSPEPPSPAPEG